MNLLSRFFPSLERPVARPRYLHVQEEKRGGAFRSIAVVLLLAVSCGAALTLWEPSQHITSPYVTSSVSRPAAAPAPTVAASTMPAPPKLAAPETIAAAADVEDDQPAPTVKLSAQCAQRATARRDCARLEALKDARLKAPEPVIAEAVTPATTALANKKPAATKELVVAKESAPAQVEPAVAETPAETPVAQPQRTAATPKAKKPRADDAPVERLVRVGEQVMPDGRRVPVYRRVGTGGYETGAIVDGEYRPNRRIEAAAPRYFGLQ